MTDQTPIRPTETQIAQWMLEHLLSLHSHQPSAAVAVADAFLERVAPAWPECAPLVATTQQEADWWADVAPDSMVSAMLVACLKRMSLGQIPMPPKARKRALVAIWNSLPPEDRTAFLDFAQPGSAAKA